MDFQKMIKILESLFKIRKIEYKKKYAKIKEIDTYVCEQNDFIFVKNLNIFLLNTSKNKKLPINNLQIILPYGKCKYDVDFELNHYLSYIQNSAINNQKIYKKKWMKIVLFKRKTFFFYILPPLP